MAEEFEFSFSMKQIEALVKALEECGTNAGDYRLALEHYLHPELITAAKAAHSLLRAKGQEQAVSRGKPVVVRDLIKDTALGDARQAYRRLKGEYMEMLSQVGKLLNAARSAQNVLRLDPNAGRAALQQLDEALDKVWFSDLALATKLHALAYQDETAPGAIPAP
jgi:hypothetical protein